MKLKILYKIVDTRFWSFSFLQIISQQIQA